MKDIDAIVDCIEPSEPVLTVPVPARPYPCLGMLTIAEVDYLLE